MVQRMKGDPLPDLIAEANITVLVNRVIPTEPFPFTRRELLRETLRNAVSSVQG
jgi:hypothetical protein